MKEITLIRHAESESNRLGMWNGRSDGPLSDTGERQVKALENRLGASRFDLVLTSPLDRARRTAEVVSGEVVVDDDLIELDLGRWDGWTAEEVRAEDGDALREALTTRTAPMGGTGETLMEAGQRVANAIDKLVAEMPDDSSAAVVTHGGLIQTILHDFFPGRTGRVHSFVDNTALSRFVYWEDRPRLASFNDTGHLGPRSSQVSDALASGHNVVTLVRHGRTRANVERRWQGQGDWDLDEVGHVQAELLGSFYGQWGSVFTSPLLRAQNTARHVAAADPVVLDGLKEINMGEWEGMTTDEIDARWPGILDRIYGEGEDLQRGHSGESWGDLTNRFRGAVDGIVYATGEPTVVVAHGGAIRSYITSLTASTDTYSQSLYTPENTSVTHVAVTDRGPMILDYGLASHLEGVDF